jgi:predicted Zn-dependent protease
MSMKQIADWALNTVTQRGAGYADVRIVDHRQRSLATKNGKVGHAASAETLGIGIRVLVNDADLPPQTTSAVKRWIKPQPMRWRSPRLPVA